jgi:glycosyltransferase involved in cell wall biosynthesis
MPSNRFLIFGQLPPPVHGSNVMAELFWRSLQNLGYQVEVVQKTFSRDMRQVERFSLGKVLKIFTISARLGQALRRGRPWLCFYFITVKFRAFIIDAFFLAIIRLFKVPYILYCHGQGLRLMGTSGNSLKRYVVHRTIAKAAGALVLGERLREDLSPYLEMERIFVLPNALPDRAGEPVPKRERHNPEVQVLFLSNLIETKGPWEFLLMAKEVGTKAPDVRFVLAGPPVEEVFYRKLLAFIERENLADRVEVPGGLFGEAKGEVFRKSDIFVFPTHHEAFGLVNLEAMQWGLPVISSDEGAIPEVVVDGVTGFIVNPRDINQLTDRVLRLVNDRDLRLRMGKAARKRYEEHFSIEAYQKNLARALEFFKSLP